MADDLQPAEEEEDDQAWLATFADLMSLLMCFFVLLLSFSEMDLEKYRQIAGSLRMAFGVQREVKADEPPKGTSVIAQEYSPGKPQPTPIKMVQQLGNDMQHERDNHPEQDIVRELQATTEALREKLQTEIDHGLIKIVRVDGEVIVRVQENGSFPSGRANLNDSFHPILERIVSALQNSTGRLIVAGHTDNVPISTAVYPSNWVLSSARAASVVHHLSTLDSIAAENIEIRAYADTRPLADNQSPANRALNRRVEIIVSHSDTLAENQTDGLHPAAALPDGGSSIEHESDGWHPSGRR